jgi:hypothetical protein
LTSIIAPTTGVLTFVQRLDAALRLYTLVMRLGLLAEILGRHLPDRA